MLRDSTLSKHNAMGNRKTNGENEAKRPVKRLKQTHPPEAETPDDTELAPADIGQPKTTDIETALPPIDTDKEAIQAYEATRLAESESQKDQDQDQPKWIPGQRSIYVDAFNLALDTVLEDESHLFDDAEKKVFDTWRQLNYEAQYLLVPLHLSPLFWLTQIIVTFVSFYARHPPGIASVDLATTATFPISQRPSKFFKPLATSLHLPRPLSPFLAISTNQTTLDSVTRSPSPTSLKTSSPLWKKLRRSSYWTN